MSEYIHKAISIGMIFKRHGRKRIAELNAIATSDESMELRKNAIQIMEDLGKRMDISLQKEVKRNYCEEIDGTL